MCNSMLRACRSCTATGVRHVTAAGLAAGTHVRHLVIDAPPHCQPVLPRHQCSTEFVLHSVADASRFNSQAAVGFTSNRSSTGKVNAERISEHHSSDGSAAPVGHQVGVVLHVHNQLRRPAAAIAPELPPPCCWRVVEALRLHQRVPVATRARMPCNAAGQLESM